MKQYELNYFMKERENPADSPFLKQLIVYTENQCTRMKGMRVFWHCLRAGKTELAKRIADKYGLKFNLDDCSLAYGLGLMAAKNMQEDDSNK